MKSSRLVLASLALGVLALVAWLVWSSSRPGSPLLPNTNSPGAGQAVPTDLESPDSESTRTTTNPTATTAPNPATALGHDAASFQFLGQIVQKVGPGSAPDWSRTKVSVVFEHGPGPAELTSSSAAHASPLGDLRIEVAEFRPQAANWTVLDSFKGFIKHPNAAFQFKLDHPLFELLEWSLPAQPWPAMGANQEFTWQLGTIELTAATGFTGIVQGPASEEGKPCRIGLLSKDHEGLPGYVPILQIDGKIGAEYFIRAPKLGSYFIAAEAPGLRPAVTTGECLAHRMMLVSPLVLRTGVSIQGKIRGASAAMPMEVMAEVSHEDFRLALPGGTNRGYAPIVWDLQFLGWREGTLERTRIHAKAAEDGSFEITGLAPMGYRLRALMCDSRRGNRLVHLSSHDLWKDIVMPPATGIELDCTTSRVELVGVAGDKVLTDTDLWNGRVHVRQETYRSSTGEVDIELTFPHLRAFQSESRATFDVDVLWEGQPITTLQFTTGAPMETCNWVIDFRKLGVVK